MDALRVDINYRPLRIAWAIRSGDLEAFRSAVRLSYTLWGGRFNPIIVVDDEAQCRQLVDLFRVDAVFPVGESDVVKTSPNRFRHLDVSSLQNSLFVGGHNGRWHAQVLDVHNMIVHCADRPEWLDFKARGVRLHDWQSDDPLSDAFLVHFGGLPRPEDIGIDYRSLLVEGVGATQHVIDPDAVLPADLAGHPSIPAISQFGLTCQPGVQARLDRPGFLVGESCNFEDLTCYWNLRAAGIPLLFVDLRHFSRYGAIVPAWEKRLQTRLARRPEWQRSIAVWSRDRNLHEVAGMFPGMTLIHIPISPGTWNGLNLQVQTMRLGEASVLGVVGVEQGRPKVSFALSEKPFSGDVWFHTQHLVASVSCGLGLFGDDQHTLTPPYVPEFNEQCGRTMHFEYDKIRLEPGRVGLVIDAADKDAFLYALPVSELMAWLFALAGYRATLSVAGLIVRQLIARLGGVQGARVFKIPGVRRLLRTHGPTAAFSEKSALDLIASKDPKNPTAKFSDHERLYIEARSGNKLQPGAVFSFLVEKGLFRIGAELTCPNCRMGSWMALDMLKQRITCELCGSENDVTRQLVASRWHYRRSGIMGAQRNAQGAVPVALTLQQLDANLRDGSQARYSPSLNLVPNEGVDLPECEVDFVWMVPRPLPDRTVVILGECKDRGPVKESEFRNDVENLRRVADALPPHRFETFVLLSKLAPFTPEEIECARSLNDGRLRTILLTDRELEPYHIYEREQSRSVSRRGAGTAEALAQTTFEMYFQKL